MAYQRVNWTNTYTTPLSADNLNVMDEGIFDIDDAVTKLQANTQALMCYPNQSNNCMKYSCDFSSDIVGTETWKNSTPSVGTVTVPTDDTGFENVIHINLTGTTAASNGSYGRLTKNLTFDGDGNRTMLVKSRVMLTRGSTASIKLAWRYNINGTFITADNIVASNCTGAYTWTLSETGKWVDLWAIVKSTDEKTINDVGIFVTGTIAGIYMSHFQVFYSLD